MDAEDESLGIAEQMANLAQAHAKDAEVTARVAIIDAARQASEALLLEAARRGDEPAHSVYVAAAIANQQLAKELQDSMGLDLGYLPDHGGGGGVGS